MKAEPFPFRELAVVPREAAVALREARRALAHALDTRKLEAALGELLGEKATLRVLSAFVEAAALDAAHATGLGTTALRMTTAAGARVRIDVEHALARTLVARVLRRPAELGDPRVPVGPELDGALLALASAVAKRAHGDAEALRPQGVGGFAGPVGERRFRVVASLGLGDDVFALEAVVDAPKPFSLAAPSARDALSSLGELPISVPVVVGRVVVPALEIYAMARGDVLLGGEGLTVKKTAGTVAGEVWLAPPGAERCIAAKLGEDGEIVVSGVVAAPMDAEDRMTNSEREEQAGTSEVVLDAPLVVRVEMGAVTLTAREWANTAPGDVIGLGRRVSEPVVLRIAGIEVARGELVDLEGELGVRIRERVS